MNSDLLSLFFQVFEWLRNRLKKNFEVALGEICFVKEGFFVTKVQLSLEIFNKRYDPATIENLKLIINGETLYFKQTIKQEGAKILPQKRFHSFILGGQTRKKLDAEFELAEGRLEPLEDNNVIFSFSTRESIFHLSSRFSIARKDFEFLQLYKYIVGPTVICTTDFSETSKKWL